MIAAALFAAAAVKAAPMEVHLPAAAAWTIAVERAHTAVVDGRAEAWTLRTEKRLDWRKGAFTHNAELTVTPVAATASPDAPADLLKTHTFPTAVTIEVGANLAPARFVDDKAVRAAYAGLGLGDGKAKAWETDRDAMSLIGPELGIVARAQAFPLVPDKPYDYTPNVPSPFVLPVKAKASYLLESYDAAAGRAVIVWRQSVDPEAYRQTFATLRAFAAKARPGPPDGALTPLEDITMSRDETCRYDIDLPTGLAVKAVCESRVDFRGRSGETRTTDRWVITQTLPEPR